MRASSRLRAMLCAAAAVSVIGYSGVGPAMMPVATSAPMPLAPSTMGSVGGIDATITAADSAPVRPGGDPMGFTITLTNATAADITGVDLVVALGHCTCAPHPGAAIMPPGSMSMFDQSTGTWVDVPYVPEGTGTDFLNVPLVPTFTVKQGQTITHRLEMRVDPNPDLVAGGTRINVIIKTPNDIGTAAWLPVTVQP